MLMRVFLKKVFVIFLLSWIAFAQIEPMNIPLLSSHITDLSSVLNVQEISDLNALATNYEEQTSNQLVVVLFPNRNGQELFDIGMKIFNENKIGQSWKNNWLLLLISTEEKKIRIIVWYGLEWVLPDALISRIIEQDIRPLVNQGNFSAAVRMFYDKCSQAIDSPVAPTQLQDSSISHYTWSDSLFFFGVILWLILASLAKIKKMKGSVKKIIISILSVIILFLVVFLGALLLPWVVAGLIFGFTWFMPGGWGGRFGWGWWFGWWWFSGWGGSSGGWGAGD
jgi:uncharacterized protein